MLRPRKTIDAAAVLGAAEALKVEAGALAEMELRIGKLVRRPT